MSEPIFVKEISTTYTNNIPDVRNVTEEIVLSKSVKDIIIKVKTTCSTGTTAPTYNTRISEKSRVCSLFSLKINRRSKTDTKIEIEGKELPLIHSILNKDSFYSDNMPTSESVSSADYYGSFSISNINIPVRKNKIYIDVNFKDVSDIVSSGDLDVSSVSVSIYFVYYENEKDFNPLSYDIISILDVDLTANVYYENWKLPEDNYLIAMVVDGYNNNAITFTDNEAVVLQNFNETILSSDYFAHIIQSQRVFNSLIDKTDYENVYGISFQNLLYLNSTTKLKIKSSANLTMDLILMILEK